MPSIDERMLPLLKEEGLKKLHSSKVVVFGLGGVGGTCFEALVRTGIEPLIGVDFDTIEPSNLNRQMLFSSKDLGRKKSEVALERAKGIRPELKVSCLDMKVDEASLESDLFDADLWIDAVDDLDAKVALIEKSRSKGIPLLVSLGMGNRLDPSKVYSTRLDKSEGDPLAKRLRKRLRERGIPLKEVTVVLSKELPLVRTLTPSSLMMVPSAAGLLLASLGIGLLLKKDEMR